MMGPSSYSRAQLKAGQMPAPHLRCIRPDEAPEPMAGEDFTGIWDPLLYNIHSGKHAFDQLPPTPYQDPGGIPFPPALREYSPPGYQRRYRAGLNGPPPKHKPRAASGRPCVFPPPPPPPGGGRPWPPRPGVSVCSAGACPAPHIPSIDFRRKRRKLCEAMRTAPSPL